MEAAAWMENPEPPSCRRDGKTGAALRWMERTGGGPDAVGRRRPVGAGRWGTPPP